ncbi:MAG TPA: competence/damage-inducible protein A [Chloroflexota bacterium]|jgi:nicotinamide-nucleotide amidase|nr:competence/damage-inducible protein A [Chloroflexota bacterium]
MRAEILSVGTELLLGQIVDTNANYLAQQLPSLGLDLYYVSQVGDNLQRLADVFSRALERSDVVISTGGVGPTEDDLTREAIATVMGEELRVQPELERQLREFFARRGRTMPERNVKQATTIPSGTFLPNPIGTAPGWWVERDGRVIISMPGVPHEMRKMWEEQAQPRLAKLLSGGVIVSRTLKLAGIGESHAEEALGELTRSINPTLATYAKSDGIHLRLTAKAASQVEASALLDAFEPRVRERVSEWLYGTESDDFPSVVGALLRSRNLSLAIAESATGGQLAALITEAPGASDYFVAGYVAYSRAAKEALGVSTTVLDNYGTISEKTTAALAAAARLSAQADIAIATTGNAGPDPAEEKPVGQLYIVVDIGGRQVCHETRYSTTRTEYKRRGALEAVYHLWRELR